MADSSVARGGEGPDVAFRFLRPWTWFLALAALLLLAATPRMSPGPALALDGPLDGSPPTLAPTEEAITFFSPTLGREMPLTVVLPSVYDSERKRYPVLYMLHGMAGSNDEWRWWGLLAAAEALMGSGEAAPFIIALPQGDQSYWVDHANGGPQWGKYLAQDVVREVDSRYRTVTGPAYRAVGGLSMGADGAVQVALNYPGVFGVVGVHSPVLRPFETRLPFFGDRAHFEAHDPVTLVRRKTAAARDLIIQVDAGEADVWLRSARAFHTELENLRIPHRWRLWPGGHDGEYWTTHAPDYVRFYGESLAPAVPLPPPPQAPAPVAPEGVPDATATPVSALPAEGPQGAADEAGDVPFETGLVAGTGVARGDGEPVDFAATPVGGQASVPPEADIRGVMGMRSAVVDPAPAARGQATGLSPGLLEGLEAPSGARSPGGGRAPWWPRAATGALAIPILGALACWILWRDRRPAAR